MTLETLLFRVPPYHNLKVHSPELMRTSVIIQRDLQ